MYTIFFGVTSLKRLLAFLISLVLILSSTTVVFATDEAEAPTKPTTDDTVVETQPPTQEQTEPIEVYPRITKIETANNGLKISFSEYADAYRYRVFIKRADSTGWKTVGETDKLEYVHTGLTNNTEYIYTVRAIDKNREFCSSYDKNGTSFTYLSSPVITLVESTTQGLKVKWNKIEGASNYKVYVRQPNGWKALGYTTSNNYTYSDVTSGKSYTFTVRCVTADNKDFASYCDTKGVAKTYIATPQITKVENVAKGTKVSWNKVAGANKYRLFYKKTDGSGWKTIANTTATSYTHQPLSNGADFTYTVRVLDKNNAYCSGYDTKGVDNTFLSFPVLSKTESVYDGMKVTWSKVSGAQKYKVYVKQTNGWKALGFTTATSFIDKTAQSGKSYTYTVRCVTADEKEFASYFDSKGITGKFVASPKITKIENTANGAKVTWNKVVGADKYRLFYKKADGSGWKTIANTTATSYTHSPLDDKADFTYTVRCCDKNGNYISGYDTAGTTNTFIAPPVITSVEKTDSALMVKWNQVPEASGYRVYRKIFTQSWVGVTNVTDAQFCDETAPENVPYTYTVRCFDESENLISYYVSHDKYYYNGELANGKITYNGTSYNFADGHLKQGYVKIDGKTYYYNSDGQIMKNCIVGSDKEGYCYATSSGVIDYTVRKAFTQNGTDWNVLNGKAYKVKTEKDRTLFRAFKEVDKALKGKTGLSKSEKLRICFDYCKNAYVEKNPRIPHYRGMDWPELYANDMFVRGTGNCFSYGACFAYMAKAIGYEEVYACHSGGHGWAEVDSLVYDPEWSRHHSRDYYAISYNDRTCDVDYKGAMAVKLPWKHIKI